MKIKIAYILTKFWGIFNVPEKFSKQLVAPLIDRSTGNRSEGSRRVQLLKGHMSSSA
jgi:hypothetical protein